MLLAALNNRDDLAEVESCIRIYLLTSGISDQIFPNKVLKLLTELDIYRWMKAAVQGREAIVKAFIALLWNSLVFPLVFEHLSLKLAIFQKFCDYSVC